MKKSLFSPRFQFIAAAVFVAAIYSVIRLPYLNVPLNRDEGIYAYGGKLILEGKLPCIDIPDYNPPLVFLSNAVMMLFIEPTPIAIHLYFYAFNFLSMLFVAYFSFLYFNSRRAALWAALGFGIFSGSPSVLGFAATAEHAALLPLTAGLLAAGLGVLKKNHWAIFLSGNLAAAACWIKQQAGFSALAILLFVAFELLHRWRRGDLSARGLAAGIAAWILGSFFLTGIIGGYYWLHGGFGELIYWTFVQGFHYTNNAFGVEVVNILFAQGQEMLKCNWVMISAALGSAVLGCIQRDRRSLTAFMLAALFGAGAFFGRAYPHYHILIAPGLAVAAAAFLHKVLRKKALLTAAALGGVAIGLYFDHWENIARAPQEISNRYFPGNPFPITNMVARLIAQRTKETDKILVIGSEPQIFLRSGRHTATDFLTITTLTERFPRHREFQERYWKNVQENDPAYIVFVNLALSICWDGVADFEIFDRLMRLINEKYELQWSYMVKHGGHFMELKPYTRHIYIFRKKTPKKTAAPTSSTSGT